MPDWGGGSCAMSKEGTDVAANGKGQASAAFGPPRGYQPFKGPGQGGETFPGVRAKGGGAQAGADEYGVQPLFPVEGEGEV